MRGPLPAPGQRPSPRPSQGRRPAPVLLWLLCLGFALSATIHTHAYADDGALAAAESAYARGSLREANRLFLASLRQPGHEREALVRIHLHLGILAGAMGAERTARSHFAIALALDPALVAPTELAGRDRSRFEQERPAHALSVVVEREDATDPAFVVRVWHAPSRLVRRIVVRCGETPMTTTPVGRGTELAAVRTDTACDQHVAVLVEDEHGGVLLRHAQASPAATGPTGAPQGPTP